MAQLIQFTLCRGPTVQTEMSLVTAGIHCMIRKSGLSGAMEDCSIVLGRQLRMLCRQRCCVSASRSTFGSLWNAVAAHEHRRQDGSRRPGTTAKCQTATGGFIFSSRPNIFVPTAPWCTNHTLYECTIRTVPYAIIWY